MMKAEIVKEYAQIFTVKELKDAIDDLPDCFPVMDTMGEPLCLRVIKEVDCEDQNLEETYLELQ